QTDDWTVDRGILAVRSLRMPGYIKSVRDLNRERQSHLHPILGIAMTRDFGEDASALAYGGIDRHGNGVAGARVTRHLSDNSGISFNVHRSDDVTSAGLFYEWSKSYGNGVTRSAEAALSWE